MRRSFRFFLVIAAFCFSGRTQIPDIRVDTTLVEIPVSVADSLNRAVIGLDKENFRIFEDGVEQKIAHFSGEDAPLSVGLVVDTSGSMGLKLGISRKAASEFLKTMNASDDAFLIEFSDQARMVEDFTSRPADIERQLEDLRPGGLTALLDGLNLGVSEMKKAKNPRKALIVISDGGDNHSTYTPAQIREAVRAADVEIYAMGVFEPMLFPGLPLEEISGPKLLAKLSEQTGGRAFGARNDDQLPAIAERIAVELRNQYVLGYYPKSQARDGKYRSIEVKVSVPKGFPEVKARWRVGYYAPAE
ncbi:MAG TPA: VWA domain-containing protein [Bryobacteraceae bacterium]|nr:VWA domain-containing protein [Bryobacteraceae bacterium]